MKTYPAEMPWLIVRLNGQPFALPTQEVRELVVKPHITQTPELPVYVRGMMNTRGQMIPVIDLRKRLGMRSVSEDAESFVGLMEQRRRDHVNWLDELEASTREQREFKLATDPHQCAFGRWYDSYKAENVWVALLLRSFAEPHRQIHSAALEVKALQSQGKLEEAKKVIESNRNGVLAKLLRLFANLKDLVRESQQEIAVVLEMESRAFAVVVDEAVAVEKFDPENIGPSPVSGNESFVPQLGSRGGNGPLVLMVATEHLI